MALEGMEVTVPPALQTFREVRSIRFDRLVEGVIGAASPLPTHGGMPGRTYGAILAKIGAGSKLAERQS